LTSIKVESGNPHFDSRNNCNSIIEQEDKTDNINTRLVAGCKNTVIPDDVRIINNYAFSGCSGLTSITIPNGVKFICVGAFQGCSGLSSISIPKSVTDIQRDMFTGCAGLTSITIEGSDFSIGLGAFLKLQQTDGHLFYRSR
jgi:hypothetical protein